MDPDLRQSLAAGIEESFKHRVISDVSCAMCGATERAVAMHVVKYAQSESGSLPAGFVPQSASYSTIRGGFPLCDTCAPACPKCQLPVPTKKVKAFYDDLKTNLHSQDTPVLWEMGNASTFGYSVSGRSETREVFLSGFDHHAAST